MSSTASLSRNDDCKRAMWCILFDIVHNADANMFSMGVPPALLERYGSTRKLAEAMMEGLNITMQEDIRNVEWAQTVVPKPTLFPFAIEEDDFREDDDVVDDEDVGEEDKTGASKRMKCA
jgi:hypothetical protein|eukprot:4849225-Prymnesium_polylepis.2